MAWFCVVAEINRGFVVFGVVAGVGGSWADEVDVETEMIRGSRILLPPGLLGCLYGTKSSTRGVIWSKRVPQS